MLAEPTKQEIDHRTLKLLVGLIPLTLASLTSFFAHSGITSISESYYVGGWSQSIFVGFLFAISTFLFAYNGLSRFEMVLSKIAAVAALGVALFPCSCTSNVARFPLVHEASATVMFLILALFCYLFFKQARANGQTHANRRAIVYAICGAAIAASILTLVFDSLAGGVFSRAIPRLVFYCERLGLVGFGISWLTASHTLPGLTKEDERFSPLA